MNNRKCKPVKLQGKQSVINAAPKELRRKAATDECYLWLGSQFSQEVPIPHKPLVCLKKYSYPLSIHP